MADTNEYEQQILRGKADGYTPAAADQLAHLRTIPSADLTPGLRIQLGYLTEAKTSADQLNKK
jgi:hypothetical protein